MQEGDFPVDIAGQSDQTSAIQVMSDNSSIRQGPEFEGSTRSPDRDIPTSVDPLDAQKIEGTQDNDLNITPTSAKEG